MKTLLYSGVALVALASAASAATCPAVTVGDAMGVGAGASRSSMNWLNSSRLVTVLWNSRQTRPLKV